MVKKIVIVGSGPAGVSAAWPLVEAGHDVLMLEAGAERLVLRDHPCLQLLQHRQQKNRSGRDILGNDLSCLDLAFGVSPKIRSTGNVKQVESYKWKNNVYSNNFSLIGVHGRGGLSNFWGCVVDQFDDYDLADWDINLSDLGPSYKSVAERIGFSGVFDSDFLLLDPTVDLRTNLPLSANMKILLNRHLKESKEEVRIGCTHKAVLSQKRGKRSGCSLGGSCFFGCKNGAAYNSNDELEDLKAFSNFRLVEDHCVESVVPKGTGWDIHCRNSKAECKLVESSILILAAGAVTSTKLILKLQGRFFQRLPILTNPTFQCAFFLRGRIGYQVPEDHYSMPQLKIVGKKKESEEEFVGILSDAVHVPLPDLAAYMPFSVPGGLTILGALQSALQLGLIYFPGRFSKNKLHLEKTKDGKTILKIEGNFEEDFELLAQRQIKKIIKHMRKLGSYLLPGSLSLLPPGADAHYAGSLPMGKEVSTKGEVFGYQNLFVVDGSILNTLPAKHLTFTIMANANRIAEQIARQAD